MTAVYDAHAPRRRRDVVALAASIGVIAIATLTPGGAGPVSGGPFCVACPPHWLADIIGNVVLFVPLGLSLAACGVSAPRAAVCGALVSLCIELLQSAGVPTGRTPAVADLASNTLGAVLGVWLQMHARWLRAPSPSEARRLCLAWAVCAVAVWALLALALQPATVARARGEVRESAVPFTPGYGWLQPEVAAATVNGVVVPHRGNGAVRVAAEPRETNTVSVTMRGRDTRGDVVPIVFVHDPAMRDTTPDATRAHLLLAQRGNDALLSSDLRAGRWGLVVPTLIVRDVFAPGRDSVRLDATISSRRWTLDAAGARQASGSLRLSPLLGWAMVQSVVPIDSPLAPLMVVVWGACWVLPLAYWFRRAWRRD